VRTLVSGLTKGDVEKPYIKPPIETSIAIANDLPDTLLSGE